MNSLPATTALCAAMLFSLGCSDNPIEEKSSLETAADFSAFVQQKTHRGPGWVAETDNPRPASSAVSPHGRVRVFFNDTLVTSLKAGHGTLTGEPLARGAMAVKELYEGETLAGHAIYYKAADGSAHASSVYYCFGPATRCLFDREETSIEKPIFGAGYDAQCHHCHGGTVFTKAP